MNYYHPAIPLAGDELFKKGSLWGIENNLDNLSVDLWYAMYVRAENTT